MNPISYIALDKLANISVLRRYDGKLKNHRFRIQDSGFDLMSTIIVMEF